jgi:hypothetical protein
MVLAFAFIALLVGTSGCGLEAELLALAAEFAPEVAAYRAKGTSGIPEVDALLEARSQLDAIEEAEKLMEEARAEGDPKKAEEAAEKRPGDYRYRFQAGAMYLEQGSLVSAEQQFRKGFDGTVWVRVPEEEGYGFTVINACVRDGIQVLEDSRWKMQQRGWKSGAQCDWTYNQLIWSYTNVHAYLGNSPTPEIQAIIAQLQSEKARQCSK